MIISQFPSGIGGSTIAPPFTYTGKYEIAAESSGWKIKFLTSGTLTLYNPAIVDIFCVGGGGNGGNLHFTRKLVEQNTTVYNVTTFGYGGGGGYTNTERAVTLEQAVEYEITVGDSGEASSFAYNNTILCTANGGGDAVNAYEAQGGRGGNGGSGGACGELYVVYDENQRYFSGQKTVYGGTNGSDGSDGRYGEPGEGQHTTTREFGEANGEMYASGGNSNSFYTKPASTAPKANTGNGGDGGYNHYLGASGIVIIRNAR